MLQELHGHSDSFLRHFDDTTAGLFWGPKVVFRMLYSYNDWKAEGLGSVHYAHAGTGTTWYTVPPSAQRDFEAAKSDMCGPMCPQYLKECGGFINENLSFSCMFSPMCEICLCWVTNCCV